MKIPALTPLKILSDTKFYDLEEIIKLGMPKNFPSLFDEVNKRFQEALERGEFPILLTWSDGTFSVCAMKGASQNPEKILLPSTDSIIRCYLSSHQEEVQHDIH